MNMLLITLKGENAMPFSANMTIVNSILDVGVDGVRSKKACRTVT